MAKHNWNSLKIKRFVDKFISRYMCYSRNFLLKKRGENEEEEVVGKVV